MGEDLNSWDTVTEQDVAHRLVEFPPNHRPEYGAEYLLPEDSLHQAVVILNDLATGINELKAVGAEFNKFSHKGQHKYNNGYESAGRRFESCLVHKTKALQPQDCGPFPLLGKFPWNTILSDV